MTNHAIVVDSNVIQDMKECENMKLMRNAKLVQTGTLGESELPIRLRCIVFVCQICMSRNAVNFLFSFGSGRFTCILKVG